MSSVLQLEAVRRRVVACRRCARLVEWREEVAATRRAMFQEWCYWGRPVPGFGDAAARLLVVGLAPAAHGANRTGRMFTGDRSGDWLYRALWRAGFASQPHATSQIDRLELRDAFVTAIVRCAPPANKPSPAERQACRSWLDAELDRLPAVQVVVSLGGLAYQQTLSVLADRGASIPRPRPRFGHGVELDLGLRAPRLIASYHPSQQNTFTGKLTESMLDDVFARARGAFA